MHKYLSCLHTAIANKNAFWALPSLPYAYKQSDRKGQHVCNEIIH